MTEFSVLVLNYNGSYEQLERTIRSIQLQKNIEAEIIICDDASNNNAIPDIEAALLKQGDMEYTIVQNQTNQGTVKNILSGLRIAKGEYAKLIGAGDMLYREDTLSEIKHFMEETNAQVCFGLTQGFRIRDNKLELCDSISPRDVQAYRQMDETVILKNLLLTEDWISGASIFARTEYYLKYISMLEDRVIYCEDWTSALSAIDHIYLKLFDRYAVWYEVGDGISTNINPGFRKKLVKDNQEFWKICDAYALDHGYTRKSAYISKRQRKKKLEHLDNVFIKNAYKSIVNPDMLIKEFQIQKQRKKKLHLPKKVEEGFLTEWKGIDYAGH